MPRILADVFMAGGRNARVLTTPGRSIQFFGGRAQVVDHRDMPTLLSRDDVRVYPHPDAMPWAHEWLSQTDWIKAEVHWPEGFNVEHGDRQTFIVTAPDAPVSETQPDPGPDPTQVDMTNRAWTAITPDALLDGPDYSPDPESEPKPKRRK